jgi:hypothetical protein
MPALRQFGGVVQEGKVGKPHCLPKVGHGAGIALQNASRCNGMATFPDPLADTGQQALRIATDTT